MVESSTDSITAQRTLDLSIVLEASAAVFTLPPHAVESEGSGIAKVEIRPLFSFPPSLPYSGLSGLLRHSLTEQSTSSKLCTKRTHARRL